MGGVAQYHQYLRSYLDPNVKYFIRGVRRQHSSFSRAIFPLVYAVDLLRFLLLMVFGNYSLVQFNTSFGKTGIIRDILFIRIVQFYKKQYVVFFHGIDQEVVKWVENKIWQFFKKTFLKANAIWVLSNMMKGRIKEWGYVHNIIVETTTVDAALLNGFHYEENIYKYKNYKSFEILFLSRIEKMKGIYEAIDAFRLINKKYPITLFRIYGDGSERQKVLDYIAKDLNRTIYYGGYVNGMSKVKAYSQGHLYLFPSYSEGMPISLLEAMAFGLPVITSSVGGIPDFFVQSHMGYITLDITPVMLSDLMESLLINPQKCEEISRFNYNYAKDHFYAHVVAQRVMRQYKNLIYAQSEPLDSY